MKIRTSTKWCKCGYKIRGKNHNEGLHHKKGQVIVNKNEVQNG